jgi:hypothetical protein
VGFAIAERSRAAGKQLADHGIRGPPVLRDLPKFDNTTAHTYDTMHTCLHGLLKNVLDAMVLKSGHLFTFREKGQENFPYQDYLQESVTMPSEVNHLPPSLAFYPKKWYALDCMLFLLHEMPLLVSDDMVIRRTKVYDILVHFSNVIYLAHHGRFNEQKLRDCEEAIAEFAEDFRDEFTVEWCTPKFHHFVMHFVHQLKTHGPAYLWDGFIGKTILYTALHFSSYFQYSCVTI